MQLVTRIQERFHKALDGWIDNAAELSSQVVAARDPRHGDYQANIAMPLAKQLKSNPRDIAAELVERLDVADICEQPEIAGPGFINLRLKDQFLAGQLGGLATDERLTVASHTPRTYVIDYSSPNVAKPMHVGHIRTTVIGDALARVLRFLGHKVISDNHLGDWGTQFGMIIYGYKYFVDEKAYEADPVAELSRIYRVVQAVIAFQNALPQEAVAREQLSESKKQLDQVHDNPDPDAKKQKKRVKSAEKSVKNAEEKLRSLASKIAAVEGEPTLKAIAEQHPELETSAQLETAKLHEGDEENLDLWKRFVPISITEIDAVYDRLDIQFDFTYGESFYQPMLAEVVDGLIAKGVAREDEGAICVFMDGFETPMIVRKKDGAFLYATTDLATIEYRMQHFKPDAILYVVDHRQSEHFEKLFAAASVMGYTDVDLRHISFGTVLGADGKPFKTRSGTVLGLEYLLDEAVDRAYEVVCDPARLEKTGLALSEDEKKAIAQKVGLGAIKYADLSHNRTSDYKFDIEAMVQLEGDTSAYIQYMYARSCNILKNSGVALTSDLLASTKVEFEKPAERELVLQLLQFEDALLHTVEDYYPSILAAYLFDLAKKYATFFDQCHVLKAPTDSLKMSRLVICHAVGRVLKQGLSLLGIEVVERM